VLGEDVATDLDALAGPLNRARVVAVLDDVVVDAGGAELPEPRERVRDDEPDGDHGEGPRRHVVVERDHGTFLPDHEGHERLLRV
jgi:hypothetical protein